MKFESGFDIITYMTSEAAAAWAGSMMNSWKSYSVSERERAIAISLAKAIRMVAGSNNNAINEAVEVLRCTK
jgi:hypothetical protein